MRGDVIGKVRSEDLLATIEAIHAAGLDEACWPRALEAMTHAFQGVGATFEVLDKTQGAHLAYHFFGLPPAHQIEYAGQYLAASPRVASGLSWPTDHVGWDYQFIDEAGMRRDPFYADFLPRIGLRYFVAGTLRQSSEEFAVLAIQRSPKQGHVGKSEIALMRRLLPHVRQAFDVARRLKRIGDTRQALERTLDWLADGVALIGTDGAVMYANESLLALVRRNDGIRLNKNTIEFADAAAREKFGAALGSALQLRGGNAQAAPGADFMAARSAIPHAYLVSVRPLLSAHTEVTASSSLAQAAAIVFVRDPRMRNAASAGTLRELFGLTEAEAALAQALQSGVTLSDYARRRGLSLNTVYTHLRRLREKTGCSRMPELIHKLNELRLPLRLD